MKYADLLPKWNEQSGSYQNLYFESLFEPILQDQPEKIDYLVLMLIGLMGDHFHGDTPEEKFLGAQHALMKWTHQGLTPLSFATSHSKVQSVKYLITKCNPYVERDYNLPNFPIKYIPKDNRTLAQEEIRSLIVKKLVLSVFTDNEDINHIYREYKENKFKNLLGLIESSDLKSILDPEGRNIVHLVMNGLRGFGAFSDIEIFCSQLFCIGADFDALDKMHRHPLHYAIANPLINDFIIVTSQFFLNNPRFEINSPSKLNNIKDINGNSLLHEAARHNKSGKRSNTIKKLLEMGADPNALDLTGVSALAEINKTCDEEIVAIALKKTTIKSPDYPDISGSCANRKDHNEFPRFPELKHSKIKERFIVGKANRIRTLIAFQSLSLIATAIMLNLGSQSEDQQVRNSFKASGYLFLCITLVLSAKLISACYEKPVQSKSKKNRFFDFKEEQNDFNPIQIETKDEVLMDQFSRC